MPTAKLRLPTSVLWAVRSTIRQKPNKFDGCRRAMPKLRAHEQAHAAAAGALGGAPSFKFERGPDGRSYAVSGEVQIDVSAVSDDPEATIRKMQQVKRAALAPADPSGPDRAIAARADAEILAAQRELAIPYSEKQSEQGSSTGTAETSRAGDAARDAFGLVERRNASAAMYRSGSAPAAANVVHVVS
jgi:SprA-related family